MTARLIKPPRGTTAGDVYAANGRVERAWTTAVQNALSAMRRAYETLRDEPFPPSPTPRHHELRGRLRGLYEYEATGSLRVRYRRGDAGDEDGHPVVVLVESAPADTH